MRSGDWRSLDVCDSGVTFTCLLSRLHAAGSGPLFLAERAPGPRAPRGLAFPLPWGLLTQVSWPLASPALLCPPIPCSFPQTRPRAWLAATVGLCRLPHQPPTLHLDPTPQTQPRGPFTPSQPASVDTVVTLSETSQGVGAGPSMSRPSKSSGDACPAQEDVAERSRRPSPLSLQPPRVSLSWGWWCREAESAHAVFSWCAKKVLVAQSCLAFWPHGLQPTRLLCPRDSPGKNTGGGCHALLQGNCPTQESNPDLPHCSWILYLLNPL